MSIDIEKFQELVEQNGLTMEPMSSFYKIEVGGRRMYVTRTKRVSRVDLSGFSFVHPAVLLIPDGDRREKRMGNVVAQLDFNRRDELVLEAFQTGLSFMKALAGDEQVELPPKYRKEVERIIARPPARRRAAPPAEPAHH